MEHLSDEFLSQYPDFAPHQSEISKFVFLRTYSRYLDSEQRREVWRETPARAVDFSMELERKHRESLGLPIDYKKLKAEAEELYDNIFNLRQFPSGRTMWVGGAPNGLGEKFALANFNCSFTNIAKWSDLPELFYLLLVGTGVGFKAVFDLDPIRNDITTVHEAYQPLYPAIKVDQTQIFVNFEAGVATIQVGDSKEGWCEAMQHWLDIHTIEHFQQIHTIEMNYNFVRPAGCRLKGFGGTSSGHTPLMEMFQMFDDVLNNKVDPDLNPLESVGEGWVKVRPIHILDMCNVIGNNVVCGGVRRTSEICLFSADDWEIMFAKYGINGLWGEEAFERHEQIGKMLDEQGIPKPKWWDKVGEKHYDGYGNPFNPGRPLHHRRMSNNSIAFTRKPSRNFLHLVYTIMRGEGEPGFVNLRELAKRRFKALGIKKPTEKQYQNLMLEIGMNPCAEIDLRSKGVCNLTTVNVTAFVEPDVTPIGLQVGYKLNWKALERAQQLSARMGLRMTLIQLELPEWNKVQQEDRLLGCSLTGWKDAMEQLGYNREQERKLLRKLRKAARDEAIAYAKELRVSAPLLDCTVKPEGTLSNVAVNAFGSPVSSGLHQGHSPHFIRRIRGNAHDPVIKTAIELGWRVSPEVGTPGNDITKARTLVVDFPVASGAKKTKAEVTVDDQFNTYFDFQECYAAHNSSNTITLKAELGEWERAEEIVWKNWHRFAAVSFLSYDGGSYQLMPFETVDESKYLELKQEMKPFDLEILNRHDSKIAMEEAELVDETRATGACPTR